MEFLPLLLSNAPTVAYIAAGMAAVALVETIAPLRARAAANRAHVAPNLALTGLTFATNAVFNSALLLALMALQADGAGLLQRSKLPPLIAGAIAVVVLDLSFYVAHVAMHAVPGWWRIHRVHHSDPAVDVTTTIRQHPLEGVLRYAFMAAAALACGAPPAAFAVYRVWSALNGLLEHANIRMPQRIDTVLSSVVVTPNLHKVHHSRRPCETNTNYGNIFSLFDRLFATLTPSARGVAVVYGLDGLDDPTTQTTAGLLALPFRRDAADPAGAGAATSLAAPAVREA